MNGSGTFTYISGLYHLIQALSISYVKNHNSLDLHTPYDASG